MLKMLVVDRMRIWRVSTIRMRSSAYTIGRARCYSRGMAIQGIVWWWLGVLLSVAIVIYVRIKIP